MAVDLTAARAARDAAAPSATHKLADDGQVLDDRTVLRVAGQAPDDCPGP
ncbi:hypothetical protein [Micromonospora sp. CPCC 206061]